MLVVQGATIPDEVIDACARRMKVASFQEYDIQAVVERYGVSREDRLSMRVADLVIEREQAAGNITFADRYWRWTISG
ncbi:hypothetical protein [Collimonas arenae]|uniref:hypothetical protein n=1 Tax=Collimonas arenae TaxID=279058 RepID=UPI0005704107|nr:hypothetical protein [Collimonas arenae]